MMDLTLLEIFGLLVVAHMLADYPLQGDFLSRGKNRANPIPGVPWIHPLTAHAIIHGGFVGIITGWFWLGLAETIVHWLTDDAKCQGRFGFHIDQAIHIGSKALWVLMIWVVGVQP